MITISGFAGDCYNNGTIYICGSEELDQLKSDANLNAGCDDGIWIYVCNSEEVDQLKEDANNNCCDGSIIYYVDVCRNFDGTHLVNGDGPNSSCSPT